MNTQALFLDEGVRCTEIELKRGRKRDRAERAVRRDRDIIGLGHGRNLARFPDATCMAEIGLHDVDAAAGQQRLEVPAGEHTLAGGNWHAGRPRQLDQCLVVLWQHRLLEEHWVVGLQRFHQQLGHSLVGTPMEIDANIEAVAKRIAQRRKPVGGLLYLGAGVDPFERVGGVHLHCAVALFEPFASLRYQIVGRVAADPGIYAHLLTHRAAEQFVHRHAIAFALDVPQRLFDARDRAGQHRAAAIEPATIQRLPQILDVACLGTKQVIGHFLDSGLHRRGLALDNRLAPTNQAIGVGDFHKQPAWLNLKQFDCGNLGHVTPHIRVQNSKFKVKNVVLRTTHHASRITYQ